MNIPVQYKPFIKRTGTGSKIYGEPVSIKCYAEGYMKVITDTNGAEVVSNKQLYVDGSVAISELDSVTFEGRDRDIRSINTFYRNGVPDIKVVYL